MFEIWQTDPPPTRLGQADTFEGAELQLDVACRRHHEMATEAGSAGERHHFEIREDGDAVAWLTYSPDITRPYESVTIDFGAGGVQ